MLYGLSKISDKLVSLLLLPIYTRYLTPEEFGLLSLILIAMMVFQVTTDMGLPSAFFRFYFDFDDREKKSRLISTTFIFVCFLSILAVTLLLLCRNYLQQFLTATQNPRLCFYLIIAAVMVESPMTIAFHYFRADEHVKKFCFFNLTKAIVFFVTAWFCLSVMHYGILSAFIGRIVGSMPIFLYLTYIITSRHGLHFSFSIFKPMFSFGFPFFIVAVMGIIMSSIDRPMLLKFMTLADVGIYSVGVRVASGVKFLIFNAFALGWSPMIINISKQENHKEVFAKLLTYYLLAAGFIVLGVSLFAKDILTLLVAPKFMGAYIIIPFLCLGHLFYGIHSNLEVGIFIKKKSSYYIPILGGSSLVYILLNIYLIPKYGYIGAGIANALAFMLIPVSTFLIGRRMFRINYEYARILKIFLALILTYGLGSLVSLQALSQNVAKNAMTLLLFPLILLLTGFFNEKETKWLRKKILHSTAG